MTNSWRLLLCASVIGCGSDVTSEDVDGKTSLGFSKSLEERIIVLEESLAATTAELESVKAQNEALLSDHETRLGDVETLASNNASDLTDFDSAYTEIIAALGDIDDNATAIAEHEDRIAYMEGLDYVTELELVASDFATESDVAENLALIEANTTQESEPEAGRAMLPSGSAAETPLTARSMLSSNDEVALVPESDTNQKVETVDHMQCRSPGSLLWLKSCRNETHHFNPRYFCIIRLRRKCPTAGAVN